MPSEPVWEVQVVVLPKAGVNDPQGEAIRGGLKALGYGGVESVRSGRFFRVALRAADRAAAERDARAICDQLLANPVIEDYRLVIETLVGLAGETAAAGKGAADGTSDRGDRLPGEQRRP